jgi:hypothetical protein
MAQTTKTPGTGGQGVKCTYEEMEGIRVTTARQGMLARTFSITSALIFQQEQERTKRRLIIVFDLAP